MTRICKISFARSAFKQNEKEEEEEREREEKKGRSRMTEKEGKERKKNYDEETFKAERT